MQHYTPDRPFRLGTRASPLALRQAEMTREALIAAHSLPAEAVILVPMVASGDKIQDRALADLGGKALWTRELDRALADSVVDAAVHSMKDVETCRPDAFTIAAMLPRADVRDRLIGAASLDALPHGARIGTSSPRRTAQLLRLRPDLCPILLRGNVGTRLAKIEAGEADATFLAAAGLDRLGMSAIGTPIPVETMLPAPQQGAIGIEARSDDGHAKALLGAINDPATLRAVLCERKLLAALGGDCRSPVAALAAIGPDGQMSLQAQLFSSDGAQMVAGTWMMSAEEADDGHAARSLAEMLLKDAPGSISALFAG
ncbi:MAG: hydroxymethylbilane synthase [Sphingopyxis sp.]